ncbi:Gfo/Idh/MocA family protein [Polynucleobacter kasalickyi]|uniref:Predicted dehydrogenase n=1 Tax=Polynucleobacter kasalickyi TaxID=1938817 RepID=A0A1W1Y3E0_9BURK|nr:Gfo/Idh/MocA family oxidoreductase [Polynucleobacter kasalickyi]SMC30647.1 Predicted dehydrogenase [Polynucleobacter kasalickyi]
MINAALVGMGWWGKNIATAVQNKSTEIRFSLGITKEVTETQSFANQHGMALASDLSDALQNPEIKAVVLATPHSLHAEQIIASANAGKHIFCEKPLTLTFNEAKSAIAACQQNNVVLAVGQNKHFWPSMAKLRELVKSGILGDVLHIEGHYSNEHSTKFFSDWRESPYESPAGGLTGTGIHMIEAFVNIIGPAKSVTAMVCSQRKGHDPRDSTTVTVKFNNGLSGYFAMVRATPIFWRVHVFGDQASIEALGENEVVVRYKGGRVERFVMPPLDSVRAELDAFSLAIPSAAHTGIDSTRVPTPYPISPLQMEQTIAMFESIVLSVNNEETVKVPQ